eukprot:1392514-Pyramimonas_sp.AAC.1
MPQNRHPCMASPRPFRNMPGTGRAQRRSTSRWACSRGPSRGSCPTKSFAHPCTRAPRQPSFRIALASLAVLERSWPVGRCWKSSLRLVVAVFEPAWSASGLSWRQYQAF